MTKRQEPEDLLPAGLALALKGGDPLMDPEDGVAVGMAGVHAAGSALRAAPALGWTEAWGREWA